MIRTLALIGGRGYAGSELLGLIAAHPRLELALASSGSRAGEPVQAACPRWPDARARFVSLEPSGVDRYEADAWVLAVPNGTATGWAEAIATAHPEAVILDLSADHRFDRRWVYGLPEHNREAIRGARRIANPGCYATGAQLGLLPLASIFTDVPSAFAVSGYSGAGRTPSPRNDPRRLRDNLLPYALVGHVHEREVSAQLGTPVRLMPHVAAWFRGISLTIAACLSEPVTAEGLLKQFRDYYRGEAFVEVTGTIPEVRQVRDRPVAVVGGFAVDERDARRVTVVVALDNLQKGAASQALQNLNLALGFEEGAGLQAQPASH